MPTYKAACSVVIRTYFMLISKTVLHSLYGELEIYDEFLTVAMVSLPLEFIGIIVLARVSEPQHYCHFGLGHSLVGEGVHCGMFSSTSGPPD